MYHYQTINNRHIISHVDLSYAVSEGSHLQAKLLHCNHIPQVIDAPDITTAAYLTAVAHRLPALTISERTRDQLIAAIRCDAPKAAEDLALCTSQHHPTPTAYKYIYTTDQQRIAISTQRLSYAALSDPDTISEALIANDDLSATCYVPTMDLAAIIVAATRNGRPTIIPGAEGKDGVYLQDGDYIQPLDMVIATYDTSLLRMVLAAIRTQAAVCEAALCVANH